MPKKLLKGGFQGSTCEKEPGRGGKGKGKGKGRDERGERWGVGGGGRKDRWSGGSHRLNSGFERNGVQEAANRSLQARGLGSGGVDPTAPDLKRLVAFGPRVLK